ERPGAAWLGGVGTAFAFQASAVTVLLAMALVQRGVVGLESAVLLVLGATVGTALKTWLFVWPVAVVGPLLVGLASLALLSTRRARARLGAVCRGRARAARGTGPLLTQPEVVALLHALGLSTLWGLGAVVAAGLVAAVLVQSSTVVVIAVLALLASHHITLSA